MGTEGKGLTPVRGAGTAQPDSPRSCACNWNGKNFVENNFTASAVSGGRVYVCVFIPEMLQCHLWCQPPWVPPLLHLGIHIYTRAL